MGKYVVFTGAPIIFCMAMDNKPFRGSVRQFDGEATVLSRVTWSRAPDLLTDNLAAENASEGVEIDLHDTTLPLLKRR